MTATTSDKLLAATTVLINLTTAATAVASEIQQSRAEGREPDLDAVFARDAAARARLQAAIDAHKPA